MSKELKPEVVYLWCLRQNNKDQVFYVGKGLMGRAVNMNEDARNKEWWAIINKYKNGSLQEIIENKEFISGNIVLKIVEDKLSTSESLRLEAQLISIFELKKNGGQLTNAVYGHKDKEKEIVYGNNATGPINQYKIDGTFVKQWSDAAFVFLLGENLVLGRCIDRVQPSSGGYQWRRLNDSDVNGIENISPDLSHKKGGNSTSNRFWKLKSTGSLYRGQREIGWALDIATNSTDFKYIKIFHTGIKGHLENPINYKRFYSYIEEISSDEYYTWKKQNKEAYKARQIEYNKYKDNYGKS